MTEDPTAGKRVIVRRVIAASQERVFRSWTEPEQLKRWWGPGGFSCPAAEVDLRPGGTYRLVMLAPGGAPEMSVTGTYDLRAQDGSTELTFRLTVTLKGLKNLMAPMVGKTMKAEVAALTQLKHVLEAG